VHVRFLACCACALAQGPATRAPDGERGFGLQAEVQDVLKLFRNAEGEDAAFVADLWSVEADVRTLLYLAREVYRERGYFAVLGPRAGDDDLAALYSVFDELASWPFAEPLDEARARALAMLWLDERFRVRRAVDEAVSMDSRELRGALALLLASARGLAAVQPREELWSIAERADLAAARLRAARLDLGALYEHPHARAPDPPELAELQQYLFLGDSRGRELLRSSGERLAKAARRMQDALFLSRLDGRVATAVARRESAVRRAAEMRAEVEALVPSTGAGKAAPPDVAALRDVDRCRSAIVTGLQALALDPFDPRLNYLLGEAHDFVAGSRLSQPYFDRFLALSGIRFYDYATYAGRHLTREEQRALEVVSR